MTLTVEKDGKIVLPDEIRKRYGFKSAATFRVVETSEGILLIPLNDEELTGNLKEELEDWQHLSEESWDMFPYQEEKL